MTRYFGYMPHPEKPPPAGHAHKKRHYVKRQGGFDGAGLALYYKKLD